MKEDVICLEVQVFVDDMSKYEIWYKEQGCVDEDAAIRCSERICENYRNNMYDGVFKDVKAAYIVMSVYDSWDFDNIKSSEIISTLFSKDDIQGTFSSNGIDFCNAKYILQFVDHVQQVISYCENESSRVEILNTICQFLNVGPKADFVADLANENMDKSITRRYYSRYISVLEEAINNTNNPITKEFLKLYYDELIEI